MYVEVKVKKTSPVRTTTKLLTLGGYKPNDRRSRSLGNDDDDEHEEGDLFLIEALLQGGKDEERSSKELENDVLEALYPETQILENSEVWIEQRCHKCGETFQNKQSKQIHMREVHSGSFICSVCGKSFSQRSGLTHHLPTHSEVKTFHCNVCGKAFRQRSGLTHHKQTHSEVKSFSCEVCGKLFAQGSGLIHHKSTHSAVKNFSCDVCGKSFAQRSGLAHHKNIHFKKMKYVTNNSSNFDVEVGNNSLNERSLHHE